MKLSDVRVNAAAIEDGAWVESIPEMGDLRLKVRGSNNSAWRHIQSTMMQAIPRNKRINGQIDPDELDRITTVCLQSASLLDWENLLGDDNQPLVFSKDAASDLLTNPEYRAFRDAVLWAATVVGEQAAADIEADVKN